MEQEENDEQEVKSNYNYGYACHDDLWYRYNDKCSRVRNKDQHTCAYSFMGFREVSRMHVSTHSYLHYNAQTQMYETRDCRIYN